MDWMDWYIDWLPIDSWRIKWIIKQSNLKKLGDLLEILYKCVIEKNNH